MSAQQLTQSGDSVLSMPLKDGQASPVMAEQALPCNSGRGSASTPTNVSSLGTTVTVETNSEGNDSHYGTPDVSEAGEKTAIDVSDGDEDTLGRGDNGEQKEEEGKEEKKPFNWGTSTGILDEITGKTKRVVKLEEVKNRIALKVKDDCPFQFHVNLIDERHPRYLRKERGQY
jgi:hypothetical protein